LLLGHVLILLSICCTASDHVTRILKEYGDTLDKYHVAPEKADISKELRVLRCVLLLIELTGTVHSSLYDYILKETTC
jgi:hypothetical protein